MGVESGAQEGGRLRVLVAEPAVGPGSLRALLQAVPGEDFEIRAVDGVEAALAQLTASPHDALILDGALGDVGSADVFARARVAAASVPIVLVALVDDERLALRALRHGAQEVLVRGRFDAAQLARTLRASAERHRLLRDLIAARQRDHFLANHDRLTGLANRHAFLDHLARAVARARRGERRLALLFVDLDHFKEINDQFGHEAGDLVLSGVAERLSAVVRDTDLLARLGGDEFVVLLADHGQACDPARAASRALSALDAPFVVNGEQHGVGASIGIATFPEDGDSPELLLRHADLAMYRAKSERRGQYHFCSDSLNSAARARLEMERLLREAVEEQQFFLEFQPQLDVADERAVGVEALVRWRHPEQGVVAPERFLPLAEETGLIERIGERVLREACVVARDWRASDGAPLRIAVNVSWRQLASRGFGARVGRLLRELEIEPERLELEVTERALLGGERAGLAALRALGRLGVRIAIDDFGTGYSSLAALRRLPVSALKIDRTFVRGVATDEGDASVTSSVLALADGLALGTVAEGVETEAQVAFLRARGCARMQGFLLGRPLPAPAFEAALASGGTRWKRSG